MQVVGLAVLVLGFLLLVEGSGTAAIYTGVLLFLGGIGLLVLGGVKIRERLRRE